MDGKTMMSTAIGAGITILIGAIVMGLLGVFSAGSDAITVKQIEDTMNKVLVTDSGDTYGQAISQIEDRLLISETRNEAFHQSQSEELARIRRALEIMAAE